MIFSVSQLIGEHISECMARDIYMQWLSASGYE
jgi:hypothetical protein